MFYLCSLSGSQIAELFGGNDPLEPKPSKYPNIRIIPIGQKDDGDLLFLSDTAVSEFNGHKSVPDGYTFIFRQEWGLRITEETIHRVIDTLRAEAYPPMSDYLDAIVKGDEAQKQKYIDACKAVKEKYPKFTW